MKPNIKNIIFLPAVLLPVISCKAEGETMSVDSVEPVAEHVENVETEEETSGIVPLLDFMMEHLDGHDRLQTVCARLRKNRNIRFELNDDDSVSVYGYHDKFLCFR